MRQGMEGPIAVILERVGPYHLARLRALSEAHPTVTIQLVAQESTYQWERLPVEGTLACKTVFCGESEYKAAQTKKLRAALGRLLKELRPSAVAISGWSEPWALEALRWCRLRNVPAILMSESQEVDCVRHWRKEVLKKTIVRLFSGALVGGKPHVRYVVKLGMKPICVRQGYDVVDNEYFRAAGAMVRSRESYWREQLMLPAKYFLACSRFVEEKNIPRLIEAYQKYRLAVGAKAWGLVLVGDGPEYNKINNMVCEKGLQDAVVLAGFRQYQDLAAYYGLAGALVHVSTREPWGLVVNEAMAAGLPVIVSNRCGCAEDLVEDGSNGFLVDPYDVTGITEALVAVASDEVDGKRYGMRSQEIINKWTISEFVKGIVELVEAAQEKGVRGGVLDMYMLTVAIKQRRMFSKRGGIAG